MKIKVNEAFESIQGEGRHQGQPVIFVRLAGCNRKCKWCDTKYHNDYKELEVAELVKKLKARKPIYVVFTGGEPLLQVDQIIEVISRLRFKHHRYKEFHLETNGDLIRTKKDLERLERYFSYICISPKSVTTAKRIDRLITDVNKYSAADIDVKVVTDIYQYGSKMLNYATMLMPLTTYDYKVDQSIRQDVWDYCIKNDLFYSARLHVHVWGTKRKK